jgi:hypothetical protein
MYLNFYKRAIAFITSINAFCYQVTGVYGQQLAFPGAEGAGKFTSGGRGASATPTTVFEVTNVTRGRTNINNNAIFAGDSYIIKTKRGLETVAWNFIKA